MNNASNDHLLATVNGTSPGQPLNESSAARRAHSAVSGNPNSRLAALNRVIEHHAFEYYRPLRRLKTLVETGYSEKITLRQAARAASLEQKYLSTYFRKKVGVTFSTWLMVFRVCKSLQLMETEDLSITEISLSVGLDLRTFERWFRRLIGCTPRERRNMVLSDMQERESMLGAADGAIGFTPAVPSSGETANAAGGPSFERTALTWHRQGSGATGALRR